MPITCRRRVSQDTFPSKQVVKLTPATSDLITTVRNLEIVWQNAYCHVEINRSLKERLPGGTAELSHKHKSGGLLLLADITPAGSSLRGKVVYRIRFHHSTSLYNFRDCQISKTGMWGFISNLTQLYIWSPHLRIFFFRFIIQNSWLAHINSSNIIYNLLPTYIIGFC